ncbi:MULTISPECIES: hypothetical protein [Bacillaceae]|uniref:hypothetical protein n=1 Tax=Bacillaceae TaxID=186817 RepID=UPI000C78E01E|nr:MULTISPECIES: hypothetical protein [Bacillus]MDW2879738.1 hypothetical protein [Bacillus infantis]PLR73924.1 hypothetical protein CYJ37_10460 [Bacillus sp. UMB0728]
MKLFQNTQESESEFGCSPIIQTPAGAIAFDLRINGQVPSRCHSKPSCYRLENGELLLRYSHKDYIAELLLCEPDTRIPSHMKIEKAAAAVWRLRACHNLRDCIFQAEMEPIGSAGWPDSGERLEAMTWEYGEWKLTLGTEDGAALVQRSRIKDMMPDSFYAEDEISQIQIVRYLPNAIAVPIPEIRKGELCQVHFVAAWSRPKEDGDASAWFAVDRTGGEILEGSGLY